MKLIKEIYAYREMIFSLVRRDLKGRYKGSVLGFLWTFINPLLQLLVYTFVFSVVMRSGIDDYYLFLFVALVPWIFFSSSIVGGSNCILSQKEIVKKIYFPREVLPVSFVLSQFINMCYSFIVIFIVLLVAGKGFDVLSLIYLPLIMLCEFILVAGITFVVSACTVYFRDLEHILGIVTMGWQYITPVLYSIEMVPEKIRFIFYLNPMTVIITGYRDILYYGQIPYLPNLFIIFIEGILFFCVGVYVFNKLQRRFAEEL